MNIQKFIAPTSREALAKARMAFGDGTLILSNRATPVGIEVIATGEDTLSELDRADAARRAAASGSKMAATSPNSAVIDDATQLAMSTLSFQDYVRERMLRRRQEGIGGKMSERPASPVKTPRAAPAAPAVPSRVQAPAVPSNIVDELQAMKLMIEDRFNTLAWLGQARQNPIHTNLMVKLLRAGYSPTLARAILERMPADHDAAQAMRWLNDVLVHNLRTDAAAQPIYEEGGHFALTGATGVGKTTTAAKLAGLCARNYGANSVGLITLDTYRIGAHEQLRAYGRMLGVVAHLAHDRAALQDLLGLLSNKKLVLIDTTGIAPNDPRKRELFEMLDLPGMQRLMVLNAGSHGDTLDDAVSQFKTSSTQQTILSKIDEAAKIGPAIDACLRHQLFLRGVTTGQKVPQDWERADAAKLVASSLSGAGKSAYDPKAEELNFFFFEPPAMTSGKFHA